MAGSAAFSRSCSASWDWAPSCASIIPSGSPCLSFVAATRFPISGRLCTWFSSRPLCWEPSASGSGGIRALGLTAITLVLIAALLGGSRVPIDRDVPSGGMLGLDWFLLNLILFSAVYIPLERLFAKHPDQPVFRKGWTTDLTYFFLNNLMIQATTLLTLGPAMIFFNWARNPLIVSWVGSAPLLLQVIGAILVADFTQYWIHRAFHQIPVLWPFHAVHHSAEVMDWLAGSRLHLVDAIGTRALTYVPIYVMGFSQTAIVVYVVAVVVQATLIHANVRWEFRPVRGLIATPCFHHWHHSAEREAIDKNFAVHTPIWDRLFGTYHMPGRWPETYGLAGDGGVPSGWVKQFVYPFRRRHKKSEANSSSQR